MFASVWVQAYHCLSMYWSLVLAVYCVPGRMDQSCGSKGVYACVYSHNRDACIPTFVVSHVWNVRYVWVSVWTEGDAGSVYVVIVFIWVGRTHPLVSSGVMLSVRYLEPNSHTPRFLLTRHFRRVWLKQLTQWCSTKHLMQRFLADFVQQRFK